MCSLRKFVYFRTKHAHKTISFDRIFLEFFRFHTLKSKSLKIFTVVIFNHEIAH